MADLKSVGVRLYALNADYKKSMKESGDATSSFGKVSGVALAAVGTAAAAFAIKAADAYVAYGKTIMGLSRVSGESVETMSKLNFAAQQSGVSSETLANGIKFLEKNIAAGNAEFDKLGVSTKNANGSFRGTHDVLLDTADAISKLQKGTEQTDAILKIFGRSGLALGPLLAKGRDGILALESEAQKYGLVLTQDNLPAIQENIKAHRQMDAAMQGAQMQIGQHVLPVLTALTEKFAALPGPMADLLVPLGGAVTGLAALAIIGPKAADAFSLVTKNMNGTEMAISGGLVLAISAVTAEIVAANAASKQFNLDTFKDMDFARPTTEVNEYAKSIDKLRSEAERLQKTQSGSLWDKITNSIGNLNSAKALRDAIEQAAANTRHLNTNLLIIQNVATQLGVSGGLIAQSLSDLHIDPASVKTEKLVDVLRRLQSGEITAAQATKELGGSADDVTKSIENQEKATQDLIKAQQDMVNPQLALMDAEAKVKDARDKDAQAQWAIVAALKARNDAVAIWGANSTQAIDAQNALNDAQAAGAKTTQDVFSANVSLDAAMQNLKTAYDTGKTSVDGVNEMLDGFVARGGMTRAEADQMRINILGNLGAMDQASATPEVNVDASKFFVGMRSVWEAIAAANAKANAMWGVVGVVSGGLGITPFSQSVSGLAFGGARASGGPVSARTPYLVGENGPELFTPGTSGNITANGRFEDGSRYGMSPAEKAALAFAKDIQRQEAMRAHPELQGRPGWGSLAVNPFAGWDPNADFSQWGKAMPASAGGSSSGGGVAPVVHNHYTIQNLNAPYFTGDRASLVRGLASDLATMENSTRRR